MEEEKKSIDLSDNAALAQADRAQGKALIPLVSQIASVRRDPVSDLAGGGSSTSTRGTRGENLFRVLQLMARRVAPTSSVDISPA